MASGLPRMRYGSGIRQRQQTEFAGYDHNKGAEEGTLWDMENLSSRAYPLLTNRSKRVLCRTLTKPNGLYAHDGLFLVDGTTFYADGVARGTVSDSKKTFASLGSYIIILPDKKYYNLTSEDFGSLESGWTGAATIQDGTYAGEEAAANTIYAAGVDWSSYFKEGDAVTIEGCTIHPENNKTPIIREIDGSYLRFYENVFTIDEGGDTESAVSIRREVPDLDFVCENENRLWGCCGDTIYASKLGDPFNWNVFDGLTTDSFAVDVGSAGDFTGCYSYLGYPCFFKNEHIYKMYGVKPSNYQTIESASLGVLEGCGDTLAIAGEALFYLSRAGVMIYSGGIPQSASQAFGEVQYRTGCAGSDGLRYFISMQDEAGDWSLFVFDTRYNLWHREDDFHALALAWQDGLYALDADGGLWWLTGPEAPTGTAEGTVASMAEFGDFVEESPNKKGTGKLLVRAELEDGATVVIHMQFDSDGVWRQVATLEASVKKSWYLPIIPRRSDYFRIRFTATGDWTLYSLTRESYTGSQLKSR